MARKLHGQNLKSISNGSQKKRKNDVAILPSLVRLKALNMAKNEKYRIPAGQFKAGNHWCQCFMKWNGLPL